MEAARDVTVLVVDDQRPFRAAAAAVLRRTPGFRLVGEAETGESGVEAVQRLHPDLVLMDITMPGISGIEATRQVRDVAPETVVFLCSTYRRDDLPPDAMTTGAASYLSKEELGAGLLAELWQLAVGVTPPAAPSPG